MAARLAILCPGQGGQHPGMFDLPLSDPATAAAVADWRVETITGFALSHLDNRPSAMYDNRLAQPLVVAATLAMWQAVRAILPVPVLVAGYSIGELAAYGVAGAVAPDQLVRMAADRAELMDACVDPARPQGMAAVSGIDAATLQPLLVAGDLHVAIKNGENAFIVAGLRDALLTLASEVERRGQLFTLLPVAVASHTPLMHAAAQAFLARLESAPFADPVSPVLSGTTGDAIFHLANALPALARQIEATLCWSTCMDAIAEAGVSIALELGPGAALARMLRERHPQIEVRSASEFQSLTGLRAWIAKRC